MQKLMTKTNQKGVKFDWSDKQETAFQLLKQKLCSAPILALPEGSEDFIAYCDASKKGLGAIYVLMQEKRCFLLCITSLKFMRKNYTTHGFETPGGSSVRLSVEALSVRDQVHSVSLIKSLQHGRRIVVLCSERRNENTKSSGLSNVIGLDLLSIKQS
ncbi:putative reverse transcriptase domain-containing protein [Tanacetum coccineum]